MFSKNKNRTIKRIASIFSLSVFLIGFAPQTIFAGNFFSTPKKYDNPDLNSIEVDTLTDAEINSLIDKEKNEYVNRAPDIFEFDDTLIEKIDHKILLLSLNQINKLFDKYKVFTKKFIEYHRKNKTKFRLQLGGNLEEDTIMETNFLNSISFSPNNMMDAKIFAIWRFENQTSGFHPSADLVHILDSSITHEFGHLMENMYCSVFNHSKLDVLLVINDVLLAQDLLDLSNQHMSFMKMKINGALEEKVVETIKSEIKEKELKLKEAQERLACAIEKFGGFFNEKENICNLIKEKNAEVIYSHRLLNLSNQYISSMEKFGASEEVERIRSEIEEQRLKLEEAKERFDRAINKDEDFCDSIKMEILKDLEDKNRIISTYGGKNAKEFFAEAFAHLECTNNPDDVNEIGRRLENYLVNVMEYLPRENSKFNK